MHFHFFISPLAALAASAVQAVSPESPPNSAANELLTPHITSRSQIQNDANMRYVVNSGVCETTPGVNQYSGYIEVGVNMSMWFWFIEARNAPDDSPITLWLNGGPGCSSMYGLFIENGPCRVNADGKTTTINPYSWNNASNVIYLDQPITTGFSYGTDTVDSTQGAAPFVWKAFQIFFESEVFSKYATREFIFATESYGGHFAPAFVKYFLGQNELIARGEIEGECIIVSAIMINDGTIDPLLSWKSLYDFIKYAPGYGQLQPDDVLKTVYDVLYGPGGCVELTNRCYAFGHTLSPEANRTCLAASDYCINEGLLPAVGKRNKYDLRQVVPPFYPPEYYVDYLHIPEVVKKIGAESDFSECLDAPFDLMMTTGDYTRSWLPELSKLVNSGLRVLIWCGDADIISNWLGVYATALAMDWYGKETLHNTPLHNITMYGKTVAAVANVDNFSYATVYEAGHELPYYQSSVALEIFKQVINKEPIHSIEHPEG